LWAILFILFIPYAYFVLIPTLKRKIKFLYYSYKVKKMANKQLTPETKNDLMEVSKHLKELSNQEKL
jgi:hypothetical protein